MFSPTKLRIITVIGICVAFVTVAVDGVSGAVEKVTLCHIAGHAEPENANKVTLNVSPKALQGHFEEDGTPLAGHEEDHLGPCADVAPTTTTTTQPPTTDPPPTEEWPIVETLDDGTVVTTWQDGTTLYVSPDGTTTQMFPNETQVVVQPDGTVVLPTPDGPVTVSPPPCP